MNNTDTGFIDRTREPICLGDVVKLSTPGAQSDTIYTIALKSGVISICVPGTEADEATPAVKLTQPIAEFMIVVEHPESPAE